jgi:hypothetical protein
MAVDLKAAEAAKERLVNRLGNNTEALEFDNNEDRIKAIQEAGQMNASALTDGERATFLPMKDYEDDPEHTLIVTESTSRNGNKFTNVYALVKRFFKNGNAEVAVKQDFINVGGIIRRHYEFPGKEPDANGKIEGAVRVLDQGEFNKKLEACKSPWNMLTNMLAGKTITAKRSDKKNYYQKFVNRQPIEGEYVEQYAMVYDFVK